MLLAVWACAPVFMRHTCQLGKEKKHPLGFGSKTTFFFAFSLSSLWKWFLAKLKKKPLSITPQEQANQYPGKFHADDNLPFCSTCNVVVDHHQKSVLDNHLSAVSRIKLMNEFPLWSDRNNRHWRLLSCAKLQHRKRRWKSAMSGQGVCCCRHKKLSMKNLKKC